MEEPEEFRYFDVRGKFKLISWDDLKANDTFYYFITKHNRNNQCAHGPFVLLRVEDLLLRNPQGVELPFLEYKDGLQPMLLVGAE